MDRRKFLRGAAATGLATALGPGFWRAAYAAPVVAVPGPYGEPTVLDPDTGIMLPPGFRVREVARSGTRPGASDVPWHPAPDGGACFATEDGGWVYVSNSESPFGGAGALRFSADGGMVDSYRILSGTALNCAGGPTPWGTWLSCEERPGGLVHECGVTGPGQGMTRPALGAFVHEAAAVDPAGRSVYLSEDRPDGRLYRFTPDSYPDLAAGVLEAAVLRGDPTAGEVDVTWERADTGPSQANRMGGGHRSATSTPFDGGEGLWIDRGWLYLTTKGDDRVWGLELATQRMGIVYDRATAGAVSPLSGVDNVTAHHVTGDLYVAEDGGSMDICIVQVGSTREVSRFLTVTGQDRSEITGPAFNTDGSRLYFSSQRGVRGTLDGVDGRTYEVTGPFVPPAPTRAAGASVQAATEPRLPADRPVAVAPDVGPVVPEVGASIVLPMAAAAAVVAVRRRGRQPGAVPQPAGRAAAVRATLPP